jgi:hypothetical protein
MIGDVEELPRGQSMAPVAPHGLLDDRSEVGLQTQRHSPERPSAGVYDWPGMDCLPPEPRCVRSLPQA